MSDLMKVGPDWGGLGSFKPFTSGVSGAQRTNDAHGRFLDAVLGNRAFFLPVAAAAPTAYVGAAGGSPLLAVHNPANSAKLLVGMMVGVTGRAAASAAGQTGLNVWSGPSVTPTGTQTNPTNALSLAKSGSAMMGFINTALTGSTALAMALPLFTYYWATAAGAIMAPGQFDLGGLIVAAPGNQVAIGFSVAPTSFTADAGFWWEEIPLLPQG